MLTNFLDHPSSNTPKPFLDLGCPLKCGSSDRIVIFEADLMKQDTPIICDLGTGYMKMGFGGENFPNKTFPSVVGRPMLRYEETIDDVQLKVLRHPLSQSW